MSTGILRVNASAVAGNWTRIQQHVGSAVRVGGVVKANAYGLGVGPVSTALFKAGCRDFFVVTVDEGIEVRQALNFCHKAAAAEARVVIMGGVDLDRPAEYIEHALTPAVNSLPQLACMSKTATAVLKDEGATHDVFLQIDSGMTRLGLDDREREAVLKDVAGSFGDRLRLAYVMSHLACADDAAEDFNAMQRANFESFTEKLRVAAAGTGHADFKRTLANSFATFRDPSLHYDLVRPGMSLYGLKPNAWRPDGETAPSPVQRTVHLTAPVVQVRDAAKGSKVSYSARFTCERDSVIGVVAIGYADGFHRAIGNKGAKLYWTPTAATTGSAVDVDVDVAGGPNAEPEAAAAPTTYTLPIVGTVCMDSCMVDLTDVPAEHRPAEGAQVEVLGPHQPPDQLGDVAGTIGYEILTSLGRRHRRVYV